MWDPILETDQFPELPPVARKHFAQFINCANRSSMHPLDWKRFYRFVRFCHAKRVRLESGSLRILLVRGHFSETKAAHLANIYEHGRAMLAA